MRRVVVGLVLVVGLGLLGVAGFMMWPTRHFIVVRNDSSRPLVSVDVTAYGDHRHHEALPVGRSWVQEFRGNGDGEYLVTVERQPGAKQTDSLGYITNDAAGIDTAAVQDTAVVLRTGPSLGLR
jgi:hypothetical protein